MLKAVIFDFDGVIVDTFQTYFSICKELFPELTEKAFSDYHKGNVYESEVIQWDRDKLALVFERQKERFTASHFFSIRGLLEELARSYALFINSSTIDENIQHFLTLGGYRQYFQGIYGASTHRSKIRKFEMIMEENGLMNDQCLFVTDTVGDLKEAKKAKIQAIAVTWGYHDKADLQLEEPLFTADLPGEILQFVQQSQMDLMQ